MDAALIFDSQRYGRPSMDALVKLVADDLSQVNAVIIDRMQSPVALIPQLAGHVISAGGKRLRPMLTLASAQLCGYQGIRHIGLAACVEFIHTATLLHDDVVDDSALRRGSASANAVWGNQASVLVGDFLFSRAFEIMVEDGSLEVLSILSRASSVIAEGEVMQLVTTNNMQTTEDEYLEVISSKTAALFGAACRIGAVIADRPRAEADALEAFGRNLGVAFQLIDDVLDYSAKQLTLGKTIGDDFREGKVTLPVILASSRGTEAEQAFWRRTIEDGEQSDNDLNDATQLMTKHDALAASIDRARHYGNEAIDSLFRLPDAPARQALVDAVEFCIERAH